MTRRWSFKWHDRYEKSLGVCRGSFWLATVLKNIFFSRKASKFRKVCVVCVRLFHTESTEDTESRAEHYGLTQTAQTFAEACGAKFCVFLCFLCATIFDIRTKVHIAPRPLCENKYTLMFLCLKTCEANSVPFCAFRVQINFRALCAVCVRQIINQ